MSGMNRIKRIDFRVEIEGRGIVNFDDSEMEQKKIFRDEYNNVKRSKKVLYNVTDENGKKTVEHKIKISSNSLRNRIFGDNHNPNILYNEDLQLTFMASPNTILRGFLFAAKNKENLKRTTSLIITDAIQTCNAKSLVERMTRSGYKDSEKDKDKADTTMFAVEKVGDISYETHGVIDIEQLQFFSTDQMYDRFSLNPDLFPVFKEKLKKYYPCFDSELGYYVNNASANKLPEYGFTFSNEMLSELVKNILLKIASYTDNKNSGMAQVSKMEILCVYDILDNYSDSDYITIMDRKNKVPTREIVKNLTFDFEEYYSRVDDDIADKDIKEMNANKASNDQKQKDDKKALAEKKEAEKAKKAAEKLKAESKSE